MPLIPALGRQMSEFEANLVYRVSSRTARATQRNPVSKKKEKEKELKASLDNTHFWGAGKMAQWLRALTALLEVLSSISSNDRVAYNHL